MIEDYEREVLEKHRVEYKRLRESELLLTTQLENQSRRRSDEADTRNLQVRAVTQRDLLKEKLRLSRHIAKKNMLFAKRDTFNLLVDQGALRSKRDIRVVAESKIPQEATTIRQHKLDA